MFNLHPNDRLAEWASFRSQLAHSRQPLEEVALLWSRAPFVSQYLNPYNPNEWPDPWHLVIDGKYDNLGVALGMLYTIKLTEYFLDSAVEIHMIIVPNNKEADYAVVIDNSKVLNLVYRQVVSKEQLDQYNTTIIWAGDSLP